MKLSKPFLVVRRIVKVHRIFPAAIASLLTILLSASIAPAQCLRKGTTHEQILRRHAIKTAMPIFPPKMVKAKAQGVTVARVHIDEGGTVKSVEILQAAHPLAGSAVSDAVSLWTFKPFEVEGQPACIQGKLTFYFEIRKTGVGIVRNPKIYSEDLSRQR